MRILGSKAAKLEIKIDDAISDSVSCKHLWVWRSFFSPFIRPELYLKNLKKDE
jgi:hypothetical protein